LAVSRSAGTPPAAAWLSRQSREAGEKNRQFIQERISFPHPSQRRERPIGSSPATGEPQYQHIPYFNPKTVSLSVKIPGGFDQGGIFDYNGSMFVITPCAAGCGRPAISGSNTCAIHAANPALEVERIGDYITRREQVKNISACGLHFEGMDFSKRKFYGCNFSGASFTMCLFTQTLMRMVFFDFTVFNHCDFSGSNLEFLSFGGSTLRNCTFEGSELVRINYGGSVISDSTFNNSNLYNSRFIDADITDSDFEDCNLKRAYFFKTRQERVNFKFSNTAEAIFEIKD
jgi:uncharacterized protein YjbI with pentapeptide repeats